MGGCFLGYLEVVSRVMVMASDLLGPLRSYKELRHDLRDSPASSILKEATVSWLAATQVGCTVSLCRAIWRKISQALRKIVYSASIHKQKIVRKPQK